jgi:protein angel
MHYNSTENCSRTTLNLFFSLKSTGYTGKFKQRTGDKCDGCAVFWQSRRIQLLEDTSVEYFQPSVPLLDRDNIGLIVRLSVDGHQLVVATTHLLYNPRRNDVRLAQVKILNFHS